MGEATTGDGNNEGGKGRGSASTAREVASNFPVVVAPMSAAISLTVVQTTTCIGELFGVQYGIRVHGVAQFRLVHGELTR